MSLLWSLKNKFAMKRVDIQKWVAKISFLNPWVQLNLSDKDTSAIGFWYGNGPEGMLVGVLTMAGLFGCPVLVVVASMAPNWFLQMTLVCIFFVRCLQSLKNSLQSSEMGPAMLDVLSSTLKEVSA